MKYFNGCKTCEDVKRMYRKLAKKMHPDCNVGRDVEEAFKEMMREYNIAFERYKNIHESADGKTYEKKQKSGEESSQTAQEYADIINRLIVIPGLDVEICGSWIWVTGNTFPHKDTLKSMKFKWSKTKTAWYFHEEGYRKRSKKTYDLDEIRNMFSNEKFTGAAPAYLN